MLINWLIAFDVIKKKTFNSINAFEHGNKLFWREREAGEINKGKT